MGNWMMTASVLTVLRTLFLGWLICVFVSAVVILSKEALKIVFNDEASSPIELVLKILLFIGLSLGVALLMFLFVMLARGIVWFTAAVVV